MQAEKAMYDADEALMEHRTTSLLGIPYKLEFIAHEEIQGRRRRPGWMNHSTVLFDKSQARTRPRLIGVSATAPAGNSSWPGLFRGPTSQY